MMGFIKLKYDFNYVVFSIINSYFINIDDRNYVVRYGIKFERFSFLDTNILPDLL